MIESKQYVYSDEIEILLIAEIGIHIPTNSLEIIILSFY